MPDGQSGPTDGRIDGAVCQFVNVVIDEKTDGGRPQFVNGTLSYVVDRFLAASWTVSDLSRVVCALTEPMLRKVKVKTK